MSFRRRAEGSGLSAVTVGRIPCSGFPPRLHGQPMLIERIQSWGAAIYGGLTLSARRFAPTQQTRTIHL